jgi:hypothetical protein
LSSLKNESFLLNNFVRAIHQFIILVATMCAETVVCKDEAKLDAKLLEENFY